MTENHTVEVGAAPHVEERNKTFNFRAKKVESADGADIGEKVKRPSITLALPYLTFEGIIHLLRTDTTGKIGAFFVESANNAIEAQAKDQVDNGVAVQADLDVSKLDLVYIANLEKSERAGISKEDLEQFVEDYTNVSKAVDSNRNEKQIANSAAMFATKFRDVRTNKQILKRLKHYLDIWFTNTENSASFAEVYNYFESRINTLLSKDDVNQLDLI